MKKYINNIYKNDKYFSIENIFLLFFLLCFTMPYVRVGWEGLVWFKEYKENPTGLPRIIELSLLLLLFLLIIKSKITLSKLLTMLSNDKIILILFAISFYVLIQPFFLDFFSFVISPTAKGVIRGNLIMPMLAYIIGRFYPLTEKTVKIFVIGLLIAGSLQSIAILYPSIFPDYMIMYEYTQGKPLWLFEGPLEIGMRRAGFWDLSTQAATFMSIVICLGIACLFFTNSREIRLIVLFGIALFIIALSSTLQRIQFIAVSFLIIYVFFNKIATSRIKRQKQFILRVLIICCFILVNLLYPYIFISRLGSIYHSFYQDYRMQVVWPSYLDFIFREPSVLLFGSGFAGDALSDIGTPLYLAHAHNQFLGWFSGIGLFMTTIFIYMFYVYYKRAKIANFSTVLNDNEKMISYFAKLVLITIFIICLAESPLQQEPISILVFFLGGIVSSMYKMHISKQTYNKGTFVK